MNASKPRVNIGDIARLAGVSAATVSRVISGSRPVTPELRRRVLAVAERFDYQPSELARNLRRGRAATVGVIVSDIQNPHFATLVGAIEDALYTRDARVLFCNSGEDSAKQSSYLEVMAAERVMGVVISPTAAGDPAVARLMDRGTPVVAIDRPVDDPRADLVVSDNAAATAAGTRLLLETGRRHIGWVGGREGVWTTTERLVGYRTAMLEAGLEPITAMREFSVEMGFRATETMLDEHPELDGLVIANNQMTIGALQAMRDRGIRIPDQLGVVAFDDPPWANLVEPPLTTIAQPIKAIADAAVEQLFRRLADRTMAPQRITLECRLQIRESSRASRG
ncbi:MAG: LacI family DNA-binding transcriptional regulator [Candidatus Dormibacteria bacterium]